MNAAAKWPSQGNTVKTMKTGSWQLATGSLPFGLPGSHNMYASCSHPLAEAKETPKQSSGKVNTASPKPKLEQAKDQKRALTFV